MFTHFNPRHCIYNSPLSNVDKLDAILQKYVAQGEDTSNRLLGAAFVVTNKDGIVYSGSAGRIDFDTASKPFSANTHTWLASATKIITCTALMQLVERGQIKLHDDVRTLIPELADMQILRGFDSEDRPILEDNTKPITLWHLLTHTVGLPIDLADPDVMKWSRYVGRTATYMSWSREGCNTPTKFTPGQGWCYGTAVDWAGLVLEKITGQALGTYMQQHIFGPLNIKNTGFWPKKLQINGLAAYPHRDGSSLKPGPDPTPEEHEIECGGAGLYSTAHDYMLFLRGFLQGKLLEEETMEQIFAPQLNEAQKNMLETISYYTGIKDAFAPEFPTDLKLNHGLGGVMNMEDVPGKRRKGSLTWSGMCNTRWWIDRDTGIAAALILNVQPHGDTIVRDLYNELELEIYDALRG